MRLLLCTAWLVGCAGDPQPEVESSCAVAALPAPGPLADARAETTDPLALAQLYVEEARLTSDPGFDTLAEQAVTCALHRDPTDPEARWLAAHLAIQFHDFAEGQALAASLVADRGGWQDTMLLGDALMEQGALEAAAAAYQPALEAHPGLLMYDRMGWLAWLTGDLEAARDWAEMAVAAGSPSDPEPFAWALTRLGWLHALAGERAPELSYALALVPDYRPALLARGRVRLHLGDPGAATDLRAAGPTVAAARALAEVDPTVDVDAVGRQDPRGYAVWLADRDPERALALLEGELADRRDAVTLMAVAYATHRAGRDGRALAAEALATGCLEPTVLRQGGIVLEDPELLDRALATGPGLLPSERAGVNR